MNELAQRVVETPTATPVEPKSEKGIETTSPEYTEKPASLHDNLLSELLEINDDHFNIPEDSKFLNEFILEEIKRQELEDTKESFKKILDDLIKRTNTPEGLDIYSKLERLSEFAKIQQKLIDLAQQKEELLKKPIEEMTSKQLKEYIEAK